MQDLVKEFLLKLGENPQREGLLNTPKRVAAAWEFLTSGYKQNPREVLGEALFESSNSEMILVRDIDFYSVCEHHLLPIIGKVSVGYIPNGKVVGLSKIPRLIEVFARRLQIQEQLTEQIADALNETIRPLGVGVVVEARHMCMEMRGVQKLNSLTSTSALRGSFIKNADTRREFFALVKSR